MFPIPSCQHLELPDGSLPPIRTLGYADGGRTATLICGVTWRLFNLTAGQSRRKRREERVRKLEKKEDKTNDEEETESQRGRERKKEKGGGLGKEKGK